MTNPTPSTTGAASITDLTSALKQLQSSGPVDVKLSTATRDAYLNITQTFRSALQTERNNMNNLETLANVGTLGSAIQTKNNLDLDVTGLSGIQKALDQYLSYLEEFEKTVTKAANRLIQSG